MLATPLVSRPAAAAPLADSAHVVATLELAGHRPGLVVVYRTSRCRR